MRDLDLIILEAIDQVIGEVPEEPNEPEPSD